MIQAIPNEDFFALVEEFIAEGKSVNIAVKGNSMRPFLPNGRRVQLTPCTEAEIRPGVVVLFRHRGVHILHRVVARRGDALLLQGDGNVVGQEQASVADVVALVRFVFLREGGQPLATASRSWRFRSRCWMWMRPFRRYLLALYDRRGRFLSLRR